MTNDFDLASWAKAWRKPMLRFARLHLQPDEEAEDAVQDTLLAAAAMAPERLMQQDPRPYLFGVLRHKITDRLRLKYRPEVSLPDGDDDAFDALLFAADGHWLPDTAPAVWVNPEVHLQSDQFFQVVDACVNQLPAKPARVFSMKELLECDAEEICATLGLSKTDYWQCMSRARKQIQLCLNQKWFNGEVV